MRPFLAAIAFCGLMSGCTPTWFQDFKSDPVKQTDAVLNSAASVIQVATIVFDQLKGFLPTDKQAVFQQKFDGSVIALHKAMDAVRAAVKAAAEAQVENPDLTIVISDVVRAVEAIKDVIDEVRGLLATPPVAATPGAPAAGAPTVGDPIGYVELDSMVESLKK